MAETGMTDHWRAQFVTWPDGFLPRMTDEWRALYGRCESPIEETLCSAFFFTDHIIPVVEPYCWEDVQRIGIEENRPVTLLWAQQKIHHFRVDFIIARYDHRRDSFARLIVECDGHEYHSTIDQQRYDNLRDKKIRPVVAGIVHMTGADIMRAPIQVAFHVLGLLNLATADPSWSCRPLPPPSPWWGYVRKFIGLRREGSDA